MLFHSFMRVTDWQVMGGEALRMRVFLAEHAPAVRWPRAVAPNADARVAGLALARTWEAALRSTQRPGLPIDFGGAVRTADLGLYGFVISTASTAREGLDRAVRFQRLMTSLGRFHLEHGPGVIRWVMDVARERSLAVRVINELVLAEHVAIFRELVPQQNPLRVHFRHGAPRETTTHARFFRCPLEWSSDQDCVEWSSEVMTRRRSTDAALGAFLVREAERQLATLPPDGTLALVQEAILRSLPRGDASLDTVAAALGRAPRTLRRELAAIGASFRELADEVRRHRATELVAAGVPMTEVALRLGFSELSALSRARRRWLKTSLRARPG